MLISEKTKNTFKELQKSEKELKLLLNDKDLSELAKENKELDRKKRYKKYCEDIKVRNEQSYYERKKQGRFSYINEIPINYDYFK